MNTPREGSPDPRRTRPHAWACRTTTTTTSATCRRCCRPTCRGSEVHGFRAMSLHAAAVPAAPLAAARLRAIIWDDCGPATQLVVDGPRGRCRRRRRRAIVARDLDALPEDVALVVRFTEFVPPRSAGRSVARADRRALGPGQAIGFGISSTRVYPALRDSDGPRQGGRIHGAGACAAARAVTSNALEASHARRCHEGDRGRGRRRGIANGAFMIFAPEAVLAVPGVSLAGRSTSTSSANRLLRAHRRRVRSRRVVARAGAALGLLDRMPAAHALLHVWEVIAASANRWRLSSTSVA